MDFSKLNTFYTIVTEFTNENFELYVQKVKTRYTEIFKTTAPSSGNLTRDLINILRSLFSTQTRQQYAEFLRHCDTYRWTCPPADVGDDLKVILTGERIADFTTLFVDLASSYYGTLGNQFNNHVDLSNVVSTHHVRSGHIEPWCDFLQACINWSEVYPDFFPPDVRCKYVRFLFHPREPRSPKWVIQLINQFLEDAKKYDSQRGKGAIHRNKISKKYNNIARISAQKRRSYKTKSV